MSQTPAASTSGSSSDDYKSIFDHALNDYKKKTKKDILSDDLLSKFHECQSAEEVLQTFRERVPGLNEDNLWTKWITPIVHVLITATAIIGGAISLPYKPGAVIFTAVGVLLSAVKAVAANQAALGQVFHRIEHFLERLPVYLPPGQTADSKLKRVLIEVMVAVLSILALVTKEIKRSMTKKLVRSLAGYKDIEGALAKLDNLIREEIWMAGAQTYKHVIESKDKLDQVIHDIKQLRGNNRKEGREDIKRWLSPTDASSNYVAARKLQDQDTTAWFTQESTVFKHWKEAGSFLWIHGKPGSGKSILTSAIIQAVKDDISLKNAKKNAILANDDKSVDDENITSPECIAYFFFDFNDKKKQDARALLISLLVQLSDQSDSFSDILYHYHGKHRHGQEQPEESELRGYLEEMLHIPRNVYLIIDALDECPNNTGVVSPRDEVLKLVEHLVGLNKPNLRLLVTSRLEADIKAYLEALTSTSGSTGISLQDQDGQKRDIEQYIKSKVYSEDFDKKQKQRLRWTDQDKMLVIEKLSEKANGMFRWVVCQLEILFRCHSRDLINYLDKFPEALDKTYERMLNEIHEPQKQRACEIFQCLAVATRPLRMEELAQLLTIKTLLEG